MVLYCPDDLSVAAQIRVLAVEAVTFRYIVRVVNRERCDTLAQEREQVVQGVGDRRHGPKCTRTEDTECM